MYIICVYLLPPPEIFIAVVVALQEHRTVIVVDRVNRSNNIDTSLFWSYKLININNANEDMECGYTYGVISYLLGHCFIINGIIKLATAEERARLCGVH